MMMMMRIFNSKNAVFNNIVIKHTVHVYTVYNDKRKISVLLFIR
jgi:hypothetical protein